MAIYGSNGSSWLPVASGDLKASDGSSWKTVKKAYRSTGSAWDEVYVGNDPQTYYFKASLTRAARGQTWKTSSNSGGSDYPQISRYLTSSNVYPWYGLVEFNQDTSGVSLEDRLAERPVVKSAKFNVQRWNAGGFGSGWGDLHIGRYQASSGAVTPHEGYCNFSSVASKTYDGLPAGRSGTTVYYNDGYLTRAEYVGGDPGSFPSNFPDNGFELGNARQVLVDHLAGVGTTNGRRPLCMSHTTSNTGANRGLASLNTANYAEQTNYWNFWPAGAQIFGLPLGPTLIVELDYA